mgnify:CR=1 FL=1
MLNSKFDNQVSEKPEKPGIYVNGLMIESGTGSAWRGLRLRRVGALTAITTLIAVLLAVPVVVVVANVFVPSQGTWAHLATTVLPEYVANTLWLLA